MSQEIFSFHKIENLIWSDFIESEENHLAITTLATWPDWHSNGMIILGNSGVGKTHIAALWAQTVNAVYVLKESLNHNPRDLFRFDCNFVIDNFDDFLNIKNNDWMFHFFNIAKEKNRFFLILCRTHPSSWKIYLNDLRSRLATIPVINMKDPNDELLLKISKKIAKDLEIIVSEEILLYILNTIDRNVTSIAKVLKILDKLSLQTKRPITIAFVRSYFKTFEPTKFQDFSNEL